MDLTTSYEFQQKLSANLQTRSVCDLEEHNTWETAFRSLRTPIYLPLFVFFSPF